MSNFEERMRSYLPKFHAALSTDAGEWVVKGFIDTRQNIYTISGDTKVISKLIELMLFPLFNQFAEEYRYQLHLTEHQNYYPDITFIAEDGTKIAVDLKSTYRISETRVSGFTLGAFTGYFRKRDSLKNISFPYQDYSQHFVLGIIYSRSLSIIDERKIYKLDDLLDIHSVAHDFLFLLQEKWKIATDRPGSGNTKNIGSVNTIDDLVGGNGVFAPYSKQVFDDYWMNYLTTDMARKIDSVVPYTNLLQYLEWRSPKI